MPELRDRPQQLDHAQEAAIRTLQEKVAGEEYVSPSTIDDDEIRDCVEIVVNGTSVEVEINVNAIRSLFENDMDERGVIGILEIYESERRWLLNPNS